MKRQTMTRQETITRRRFLQATAATAYAIPTIVPSTLLGRTAPSKKMNIAFIGTGNNGTNWLRRFLKDSRVQVVAVCDVNREGGGYWDGSVRGREPARKMVDAFYDGKYCAAYEDFVEICLTVKF